MERLHSLAFHATATPCPSIGFSVLHAACIEGDNETIRNILSFSPNVVDSLIALSVQVKGSSTEYEGMKPEEILRVKNTPDQQKIQEFTKKVFVKGIESWSLIHVAAKIGTVHNIRRLLRQGADIDEKLICVDDYLNEHYAGSEMSCSPLHIAAAHNTVEVSKELITLGANILAQAENVNSDGYTAAHFAAKGGNTPLLLYLLEEEGSLRDMVCQGFTPLHLATSSGHTETVAALISCGANVNEKSYGYLPVAVECYGTTPCMIAAFGGHMETFDLLAEKGGNIHACDELGRSLFYFAIRQGHIGMFKKLLGLGLNPSAIDNNRQTLLHEVQDPTIAKLLIDEGVNVDARNNCFQTPLHAAASECNIEVIEVLSSHGADVNAQDACGNTPVGLTGQLDFLANSIEKLAETIQLLVKKGADVNITDVEGRTPLMNAVSSEAVAATRGEKVQTLLECGSDLSVVDRQGRTCLHHASSLAMLQILIERGLDYKATDNEGNTVLHSIVSNYQLACILNMMTYLLENDRKLNDKSTENTCKKDNWCGSPFVNAVNNKGQTALHLVVKKWRDKRMVQLLLQYGCDVNAQDSTGETALHNAGERGCLASASVLLENGADPNITDHSLGNTALHKAVIGSFNYPNVCEIVEKLLHHDSQLREANGASEYVTALAQVLNKRGQSALHLAAKRGQVDTIRLLFDQGCDMHARDCSGKTPVMYSVKHPDALQFFKDQGGKIKPPYEKGKLSGKATKYKK